MHCCKITLFNGGDKMQITHWLNETCQGLLLELVEMVPDVRMFSHQWWLIFQHCWISTDFQNLSKYGWVSAHPGHLGAVKVETNITVESMVIKLNSFPFHGREPPVRTACMEYQCTQWPLLAKLRKVFICGLTLYGSCFIWSYHHNFVTGPLLTQNHDPVE